VAAFCVLLYYCVFNVVVSPGRQNDRKTERQNNRKTKKIERKKERTTERQKKQIERKTERHKVRNRKTNRKQHCVFNVVVSSFYLLLNGAVKNAKSKGPIVCIEMVDNLLMLFEGLEVKEVKEVI
jgi:hypothetical protein